MKRRTAILFAIFATLLLGAPVFAQTSMNAGVSAEAHTGGGLGSGISHMVRNILGDTPEAPAPRAQTAPAVIPMQATAAPQTMMMQMNTHMDASGPEARSASLMSAKVAEPLTDEALYAYVSSLMDEDSNIQSIDTASTHVRVTYAVPSKVFGLVRVWLKITVGAYASGGTEVSYPWYTFAASKVSSDFRARVNDRIEPMITSESMNPDQQKSIIDEIHAMLAAEFGSSTRGDQ